jgi:hypothetical protein
MKKIPFEFILLGEIIVALFIIFSGNNPQFNGYGLFFFKVVLKNLG